MEQDIICVSKDVEIHPTKSGEGFSVVRKGRVYGIYATLDAAREIAEELAEKE